jgi:DNA-binding response OmpR family regulator
MNVGNGSAAHRLHDLSFLPDVPNSTSQDQPIEILSVSGASEDHAALRRLASGTACRIAQVDNCKRAMESLSRYCVSVVVCERDLPDGSWRDILAYTDASRKRPLLIVTSRLADERLWADVLNLGGFDLLAKPFDPHEVRHVLTTAYLRVQDARQQCII